MVRNSKKVLAFLTSFFIMLTVLISTDNTVAFASENQEALKQEDKLTVIDILTFNDFHGNVLESGKNVGAAKLSGVVNSYKDKVNDNYNFIPVSGGDLYQGTAISNIKVGEPVTDMLKAIGLEASAIGNHEFDWGTENISKWSKEGNFSFLAANIVNKETGKIVDYAEPYKIVERNGIKVGFIGIATPETATSTLAENVKEVEFKDPATTVKEWAPILKEKGANAIVALTHCAAYQNDETRGITGEAAEIAKTGAVNAVIAAHNHAFVCGEVNNVPIVEGGYNGRGLGKLTLSFDKDNKVVTLNKEIQKFQGKESELPVDADLAKLIEKHDEELAPIKSAVVTKLEEELSHEERGKSVTPLGVTVAETMRQITGTDIGLCNGGGIRRTLAKGDVTVGDMYEILPFDNTLVTIKMKGKDIVGVIEHGINTDGFGWGQFAGIKVWYDPETGKVSSIRLNDGAKLEEDKYYTLTINDFILTGGDGYDFSKAEEAKNTNIVMRDAMSKLWKEKGVPKVEVNVLVAGEDNIKVEKPAEEDKKEDKKSATKKPTASKSSKTASKKKLPKTGMPVSPDVFAFLGVVIIGAGAKGIIKNKKVS